MQSRKAWVERPRGLLKEGVECKRLELMFVKFVWLNEDNVLRELTPLINLNCYMIKEYFVENALAYFADYGAKKSFVMLVPVAGKESKWSDFNES